MKRKGKKEKKKKKRRKEHKKRKESENGDFGLARSYRRCGDTATVHAKPI